MDQQRSLDMQTSITLLNRISRALHAAHAAGIAHRDLKPANVFITRDEDNNLRPVLLDFGVAKLLDAEDERGHSTATGAAVGTPAYMSPEQCVGKNVDHRTDIYAFGILAYELLTGKIPFMADSHFELMSKHMFEAPPAPAELVSDLPKGLSDAVMWMLEKDKADRPQSIRDAVEALNDAAKGHAFVRPPPTEKTDNLVSGPAPTPAPWQTGELSAISPAHEPEPTSSPKWLPIAIASALVGAVVAVGAYYGQEPEPPAPPTEVTVTVLGVPAGAQVLDDAGHELRHGPGQVVLPQGSTEVALTIRADGFEPKQIAVVPDAAREILVQREARPKPTPAEPPPTPEADSTKPTPKAAEATPKAERSKPRRKKRSPSAAPSRAPDELEPWE